VPSAPDRGLLRKLAEWDTGGLAVTSLYLDVDGRRHLRRGDHVARVEDLIRKAPVPVDRDQAGSAERDLRRIDRFVKDDFDRRGVRGLVVFSCAGADLWEDIRLSRVLRDRLVVRPRPYLLPLEAVVEGAETFCVAMVDRQEARILRACLGEVEEVTHLLDEVPGRHDQGGWAQARHARHIEDHVQRHLKHVAEVLLRVRKRLPFDHLVLAGPHEVIAELQRELHDYLARAVVDRAALPMTASLREVAVHVDRLEARREREREAEAVRRLTGEVDAGRAAGGLAATLEALERGRVDTLVVSPGLRASGVRCPACGHLDTSGERCAACGAATVEAPDLPEEAVEAALLRGCRVETTEDAGLSAVGGIGALLRF
jgi:peptide chain release factor subunit 1